MLLAWLAWALQAMPSDAQEVNAYLFWREGCPYCETAREALAGIAADDPGIEIEEIELGRSLEADLLFQRLVAEFGIAAPGVPLLVVGESYTIGFALDGRTTATYRRMIEACRAGPCPDPVARLRGAAAATGPPSPRHAAPAAADETVSLPWIGELTLRDLSLPVLTVVLAAIDGFNPCAMWVLALLIGFLLGVREPRRMWTLGAVFLLTTGVMYFAVMSAWLNVVLWLGALSWLRLAIGALAIGAGVYYLREYWTNPEGVCRVTPSGRRRSIRDAFQRLVEEPKLGVAALGIAVLAVGVNLIELACSAGIPAVYTQMLAMHDPSTAGAYGYLLLYIAVFLMDDTAIFVAAMVTLRAVSAGTRFSRLSHLIGGIVLLGLGALMILRPDLLT